MIRPVWRVAVPFVLAATLVGGAVFAAPPASDPATMADAAMQAYWDLEYTHALSLVGQVLDSPQAGKPEKISAHQTAACVYVVERRYPDARTELVRMFEIDPAARFSPDYKYPPPVIDLYHTVRDSLNPGTVDIHTIAVGDFEDNSVYRGTFKGYDFSLFGPALAHTVTADLAEATHLSIVDRQRTGELMREIELGQTGFANPGEAVRAGQMLGAHAYIFGQYMILSKKEVRIDARVVRTATGEVILTRQVTGEFGGKPEKFLALEKELVLGLAEGLEKELAESGETVPLEDRADAYFRDKEEKVKGHDGYVEGKFLSAEALQAEDRGDYAGAMEKWKKVLEADPNDKPASERVRALQTMLRG